MKETVLEIAKVAEQISEIAGVSGSEVAGLIVSVLAANPELIKVFSRDGPNTVLSSDFKWERGCLTWYLPDGEIARPIAHHRH